MDYVEFTYALTAFIKGCQRIHTDHMKQHHPNVTPDVIGRRPGKKYVKIVRARAGEAGGSVHCFVDMTNGDVLKAASWKAPAKHARGNIFDEHNGLGSMGEYGPAYLH